MTIDRKKVMSVYSGTNGKCCCGCHGRHSYTADHAVVAGKSRGYPVTDDEINEGMITKVVRILNQSADTKSKGGHAHAVVGNRLYIAYFLPRK